MLLLQNRAAKDNEPDVRIAAIQGLARGWKDDPETLPLLRELATQDESTEVREAVVEELMRCWRDDSSVRHFIHGLNLSS